MTADQQNQRRVDARRHTRAHLADRPAVALCPDAIRRGLSLNSFETSEISDACLFLESLAQVEEQFDPLGGSTRYYKITASGIIANERG